MLKLVDSDEFEIHSFLNNIKSEHNHTISILDEVILGVEKIIAMPNEWAFPDVPLSVFETSGDDLANQLLEGVQFMHKNKVAHLDLKPDNILVTRTTRPLRLLIIDFSVSVHVDTEESWIEGYRGTEGWTAPELRNDKYQPIRADLWSVGRVLQYIARRRVTDTNLPFKYTSLAKDLLHDNPSKRPLLSNINLCHEGPQTPQLQLKPKRAVDEWEENRAKRRWLQSAS